MKIKVSALKEIALWAALAAAFLSISLFFLR
jgi:hypothetical protein